MVYILSEIVSQIDSLLNLVYSSIFLCVEPEHCPPMFGIGEDNIMCPPLGRGFFEGDPAIPCVCQSDELYGVERLDKKVIQDDHFFPVIVLEPDS
jgi:hypothetical protein